MRSCTLCGGAVEVVLDLPPEPVLCNALARTRDEARSVPTGPLVLSMCHRCGVGHNEAFDPSRISYGAAYDNSLHFSPTFQRYAESLAGDLVARHELAGRRLLEIGAGNGDFLALLCEAGGPGTTAVGFDPSGGTVDARASSSEAWNRVEVVRSPYPTDPGPIDADFVCARHVLEHLEDPRDMLEGLSRSVRPGRDLVVYLEVPDGGHMLAAGAVWDLIYEHPWYYTEPALRRLLASAGFTVLGSGTSYGGQYLWAEAHCRGGADRVGAPPHPVADIAELRRAAQRFGAEVEGSVRDAAAGLRSRRLRSERVALWGAGSKGVTFLNRVPGAGDIDVVIDVNPAKQGRYVPGTGQRVRAPGALSPTEIDTVVLLNPLYREKVAGQLARLGIDADLVDADLRAPLRQGAAPATASGLAE